MVSQIMTTYSLIASIDIGTTSTRVILFTREGKELIKHQIEYKTSANSRTNQSEDLFFSDEGVLINPTEDLQLEKHEQVSSNENHPITLNFPKPGWVEVNPVNILRNVLICFAACLSKLEAMNRRYNMDLCYTIKTIGIANMRETTILWSKKTGKPFFNGIVWNDTRTNGIIQDLKNQFSQEEVEEVHNTTGLPIASYFSAAKIRWLIENVPEIKEIYENPDSDDQLMFGTVDTWLVYNLTKEQNFVTDLTNASRTCLMNLSTMEYDDSLFYFWGLDRNRIHMPEIRSSSEFFGTFKLPEKDHFIYQHNFSLSETSRKNFSTHLSCVPITGILGDQSASMVGQLILERGLAKCTYGTGAFLLYNTGDTKIISSNGTLTTVSYWFKHLQNNGEPIFALEGSIAVAGSLVNYLRDNLKFIDQIADINNLIEQVEDSSDVVFVPAFSGLYSPYWINTRGNIFGLTQYTNSSHIARAAMEGICFQVKAILQAMDDDIKHSSARIRSSFADLSAFANHLSNASSSSLSRMRQASSTSLSKMRQVSSTSLTKMRELSLTRTPSNMSSGTHSPNLEFPSRNKGFILKRLSVDGGLSKSDLVMQIQADTLGEGITISKAFSKESTALGAAIAAGFGFEKDEDKVWKTFDELIEDLGLGDVPDSLKEKREFHCMESDAKREHKFKLWEKAVERSRGWLD